MISCCLCHLCSIQNGIRRYDLNVCEVMTEEGERVFYQDFSEERYHVKTDHRGLLVVLVDCPEFG